jgi:hypothetical protein
MDNKLLLVNGISLLYRESQLVGAERSTTLVRHIVSSVKLPEISIGIDHDRDILDGLKTTAFSMCSDAADQTYVADELLQRLRVNCGEDERLFDIFVAAIAPELSESDLKHRCINLRRDLNNHFRDEELGKILKKGWMKYQFNRHEITDMQAFVAEYSAELEPYRQDHAVRDPAVVSAVSFDDPGAVQTVYEDVKKMDSGESILQTGYQGINRMLRGGFRPGDQVVIGALQHNYKTGFSLTLFKQLALYNKPVRRDPNKKPLLMRISFEDDIVLNFQFLYSSLKENETGEPVTDLEAIDAAEMTAYVRERMMANGWHIHMMRVNPSLWSYQKICDEVLKMEAQGFEVHVLMLDYLALVPTTGCTQGALGQDVRDMYRRMRNFTNPRKIITITPHQLSTEAKMLIREGRQEFVKEVANKGYYDKCKTIDQEVDIEIYIHKEVSNGDAYLTYQRGKHRLPGVTPQADLYGVLPFTPIGGILDDIGKADTTRRKVGGGPIGSGQEVPFWEIDAVPMKKAA